MKVAPTTNPNPGEAKVEAGHKHHHRNPIAEAIAEETADMKQVISILIEDEHGHKYKYVVHPYSKYRRAWDVVTVFAVLYLCWKIPFSVSFDWYTNSYFLKYFEYTLDFWFAADIVLNFRTGFIHNGHCVMDPKQIMKHYLEFWFWIDILASIPFEIFGGFITSKSARKSIKMVKWFKIPRLMRLGRLLKFLRHYARFYGTFVVTFGMLFMMHCAGCTFVAAWAPCLEVSDDPYLSSYYYHGKCAREGVSELYYASLHWGVSMFLGQSPKQLMRGVMAENEVTFTVGMYMLSSAWMLVGLGFVSALMGNVSRMMANSNHSLMDFRKKLEKIKGEMTNFSLPENLQYRVKRYYDYLWLNHHFGELSLINDADMSRSLRREIALFLYKDIIIKVPFLRKASLEMLAVICCNLRFQIFMPSEYVFHIGDIGRALYVISKGTVAVLASEEPRDEIVQLGTGSYFGEMALMSTHGKRGRSVQAKTVCEMNSLGQDVFSNIREEYPDFDAHMRKLVKDRQVKEAIVTGRPRMAPAVSTPAEVRNKYNMAGNGGGGGAKAQSVTTLQESAVAARLDVMEEDVAQMVTARLSTMENQFNAKLDELQQALEQVLAQQTSRGAGKLKKRGGSGSNS